MGRPIRTILIVGGGLSAWMTAAALLRHVPGVEVTVLNDPARAPEIVDLYGGSGPSFRHFARTLAIDERNLVGATGGVFRLGQWFDGWGSGSMPYLHGYAPYGTPIDGVAFHQLWLRAAMCGDPVLGFDAYSYASMLARAGAFAFPDAGSQLADFDYGFNLDAESLCRYFRELAEHVGARRIDDAFASVRTDGEERIVDVLTRRGNAITADHYIDCTGAAARLLSRLRGGDGWEDWRHWLPCDSVAFRDEPAPVWPDPFDRAVAAGSGWRLEAPLRRRTLVAQVGMGAVDPDAGSDRRHVTLAQGMRQRSWIGNCVGIGEAAVVLEPLEAAPISVLCESIGHLIALLPDTDFAAVELAEYQRRARLAAEARRDLLVLHYRLTDRPEPLWRMAREERPPSRVADVLALFAERGRVFRRDGEPLTLEDWLAVLLGQGGGSRRVDAGTDRVPCDKAAVLIGYVSATLSDAAARALSHRSFLNHFLSN